MNTCDVRSYELNSPAYKLQLWAKYRFGWIIGTCVESAVADDITLRVGMVLGMDENALDLIAQKAQELGVLIRIEKK